MIAPHQGERGRLVAGCLPRQRFCRPSPDSGLIGWYSKLGAARRRRDATGQPGTECLSAMATLAAPVAPAASCGTRHSRHVARPL